MSRPKGLTCNLLPLAQALVRTQYALGRWKVLKAMLRRDWILMERNRFLCALPAAEQPLSTSGPQDTSVHMRAHDS